MLNRDFRNTPNLANQALVTSTDYEYNPGAVYGEHIRNTGAICNCGISHTCGNVLSVVEKHLLSLFPEDLFKTVTASTTLASRQIRSLPHQLFRNERPMMVLVPRISFGQGDDRFLANTLFNSRRTDTHSIWGDGSLMLLAKDVHNRLYIHGHYNRMVMFVDVILTFDTFNEQINYMSYLHNMIPIGHNKFIRAPLELYIPDEICSLISNLVKIPITDKDGSVNLFLHYMNSIWGNPITFKLKGGSNSNEFFMYYLTDLDTVVQEPQLVDANKDGQVKRNFSISFTVRVDFNSVGYFTLNHPNVRKTRFMAKEDFKNVSTIFSDWIDLRDFTLPVGWSVLGFPIFKLKPGENSISLDPIFNESLRAVIKYHFENGMPMDRFLNIQFRENGRILSEELFYIDWETRVLHVLNPSPHRTYRLIVTVSADYINSTIKQIYNLE